MSDQVQSGPDSVRRGVGQALALHLFQIVLIPAITFAGMLFRRPSPQDYGLTGMIIALAGWGVTQFIYLGPAILMARRAGRTETAKGIVTVAAVGFLLNGACDALLLSH